MRYLLKKIYENGSVESFAYALLEEAKEVMDTIADFKEIGMVVLLDTEADTVVRVFHCENGILRASFWDADLVKLRKDYCEPGEEKYIYRVTDINENTGCCLIVCENSRTPIPCSECVGIETVEPVV